MKAFKLSFLMGMGISTVAVAANMMAPSNGAMNSPLEKNSDSTKRIQELGKVDSKSKLEQETSVLINDPAISQAWGLRKTDAAKAWEISQGSRDVVVAIIDTGIDAKHEDLAKNLWTNNGETGKDSKGRDKATNGVDDDGNGFVDDVNGWNFVSNNNNLEDNHGHGTHIAGIVGAQAGNGKGIAGIAPNVSMMVLKYYDPKVAFTDNLRNTILAIRYAVKMGAQIINYSGGGLEFSQDEKDAIELARQKGILFVAAAGNERTNSDKNRYYPADYGLSNIISVTAIDPGTEVLASSNFGVETVDIAAPGQGIISTLPNSNYGPMTGTSQATAFVTGAAALVMAHKKTFQAEEVKKYILATGEQNLSLLQKTRTSRQLNLFKSLAMLDQGVSANGLTAVNTQNMKNGFASDPNTDDSLDSTTQVSRFGKNLIETLGQLNGSEQPQ